MLLLIIYVSVALCFSFLCSISEAVILSTSNAYIALLEKKSNPAGKILHNLKAKINRPLSAILILNTIAHTIGAVGAGAQATAVFGSTYVGLTAVILTLLILVFSEIIPKTLGAHYWRQLAPVTAYTLKLLIWLLYPLVLLSEKLTTQMLDVKPIEGFSRSEFAALTELGVKDKQLALSESIIMKNLLKFRDTPVRNAMTPVSVVFKLPVLMTVGEYFHNFNHSRFSRIPVYSEHEEMIEGFVLRNDLLLAQARGEVNNQIKVYQRELTTVLETMSLSRAFDASMRQRVIIMLVVNEYGGTVGILTLEDLIETLLGQEIIDERDKTTDMQELARRSWRRRAKRMGLDIEPD